MASIFDPNPKTGLTGLETLLGNVVMPQQMSVAPTNKQMIDAAILRGSLELLKPKQPNENFASQASRALEAAGQPAKTLADHQAKLAASRASRQINYVGAMKYLDERYNKNSESIDNVLQKLGDFNSKASSYSKSTITQAAASVLAEKGEVAAAAYLDKLLAEQQTLKQVDGNFIYEGTDPVIINLTNNLNIRKEEFYKKNQEENDGGY